MKKFLIIMTCSIATLVIGSFSKLQQSLSGSGVDPVGQRLANESRNCCTSCTYKVSPDSSLEV